MRILYENTLEGICIRRCYGLDGILEIPESVKGRPVTELAGYLLSDTVRGREQPPSSYEGEPELCGSLVKALRLPGRLRKVGAYAFYNCCELERISCSSAIEDWGAGVFTGCAGIRHLDIRIKEGRKSCFREILSELRQTLSVDYRDGEGRLAARLIFPEFFEESVENTPARIIMREMHGCGHMYRYCFDGDTFRFGDYDALFPHVKVREKPELAARLALYRLRWPLGLGDRAAGAYWDFVGDHALEGAAELIRQGDTHLLGWMAQSEHLGPVELQGMLDAAAAAGDARSSSLILDVKHRRFGADRGGRRTFVL